MEDDRVSPLNRSKGLVARERVVWLEAAGYSHFKDL